MDFIKLEDEIYLALNRKEALKVEKFYQEMIAS